MYAWIWRRLPFGLPGKLAGSVLIATALVALLWYVIFPWAEPLLPFDDVQVTQDSTNPGGGPDTGNDAPGGGTDPGSDDEHDLPYDTSRNNTPPPSKTPNR
ncbi:hypothetical protein GCM10027280_28140 [Micromonospora polyrhachis]|uniref:Uncharacterized protein n=1 Tax=Micromonospora polyrhachis TaxID=1282883 RepID=A0A7W7ST12_9ACTN|nr:hypothetical protein [Micromonospora polyrhachis]MBB4959205.1 hypothetical protein [Micromonospora polyrhachis]